MTRFQVGEPTQAVLSLKELADGMGWCRTKAWEHANMGDLDFLQIVPQVGVVKKYSGKKVRAWLAGELEAPVRPSRERTRKAVHA